MKIDAKKLPKFYVLIFTSAVHGVLLFGVVFSGGSARQKIEEEEAVIINLVNIEEFSEPLPPPAPKKTVENQVENEPVVIEDDIAENIIETEVERQEISGAADGKAEGAEESAVYIAQYTKQNYSYIQKRIMQELIYPSQARRAGVQGVVEVVFTINTDGSIRGALVRKSSEKIILDEEALRAVQSAAPFRPPQRPVKIVIPVSFKLT
jgi:protein TonB